MGVWRQVQVRRWGDYFGLSWESVGVKKQSKRPSRETKSQWMTLMDYVSRGAVGER